MQKKKCQAKVWEVKDVVMQWSVGWSWGGSEEGFMRSKYK